MKNKQNLSIEIPNSEKKRDDNIFSSERKIVNKPPMVRRMSDDFKYQKIDSLILYGKISDFSYLNPLEVDKQEHQDFIKQFDDKPIFLTQENAECWIFKKNNRLIISFRGTSSLSDATTDLYASKKTFRIAGKKYGKVHKGFYNYYMNLRQELLSYITTYINNPDIPNNEKYIVFTGHSLGSCSILGALEIAVLYPELSRNIMCINFGSPRVGDEYFRDSCKTYLKYVYRIVNDDDPIPRAPTRLRFTHSHPEIKLNDNNGININKTTTSNILFSCFHMLSSILPCISNPASDHKMGNYIKNLELCKKECNILECPNILSIQKFEN